MMKKLNLINNNIQYEKLFNKNEKNNKFFSFAYRPYKLYCLFLIYLFILIYLLNENNKNKNLNNYLNNELKVIKQLLNNYNFTNNKDNDIRIDEETELKTNSSIKNNNTIDIDMIGLKYPEIMFDKIKEKIVNNKFKNSLLQLLEELEIKLIYLEKEINATKINAFYTARTLLLKDRNIEYDDSNITELHNIVSWLIIHRSTQLKGIVSDKYLACKYSKMKLGIDLCPHRIGVYNHVEDINFKKLIELGDVILKISNGNHDNTYIFKNREYNIENLKKQVEKSYYRNFPLIDKVFSHNFSKKRIVLEKIFIPISDLYEFKFVILNNNIKIIYIRINYNKDVVAFYYDSNFNLISKPGNEDIFKISTIPKKLLDELKKYALKLSEDFPNFIRIDLYLFHEKIYLSELTFDHREGKPFLRENHIIKDAALNWKRIDCDL